MTHTQTEREEIRLGATYDFHNRVLLLSGERRRIVVITRYTNTRGFQSMGKNFRRALSEALLSSGNSQRPSSLFDLYNADNVCECILSSTFTIKYLALWN